ncbi:unnamed protein product [Prunus armeniaca]
MLGLRYALGLDRACDLQDSKCSVRPRAPVWYRPKALRCLSKYGFSKVELQINRQYAIFDVRLWTSIVSLPRVLEKEVALIVGSGSGKLEAFIEKRRRKNAAKDHRFMPYRRPDNTEQQI